MIGKALSLSLKAILEIDVLIKLKTHENVQRSHISSFATLENPILKILTRKSSALSRDNPTLQKNLELTYYDRFKYSVRVRRVHRRVW